MLDRILEKFDILMSDGKFKEAEELLLYWKQEFKLDIKKLYTILNELIGFYRKQNIEDKCLKTIDEEIILIKELGLEDKYDGATGYINIATAYTNFKKTNEAIEYFEKAKNIYEKAVYIEEIVNNFNSENRIKLKKLASLYNNMANALADMKKYDEAIEYDKKAIKYNSILENAKLESAITYLNMAEIIEHKMGLEKGQFIIDEYVNKAYELIGDDTNKRDRYYVFVCEKCVNAFDYYGYFIYAQNLRERIKEIRKGF